MKSREAARGARVRAISVIFAIFFWRENNLNPLEKGDEKKREIKCTFC